MIKKMRTILPILFSFILLAGCKTQQPQIIETPVRTTIKEVDKLVPVYIPADSAVVTALLECDSLNNVRIKEINELKSKGVESGISLTNNKLQYRTIYAHDTVYLPSKTVFIEVEKPIYIQLPPEIKEVNKLTFFQNICVWIGRVVLILLAAGGISLLLKFFKPFK